MAGDLGLMCVQFHLRANPPFFFASVQVDLLGQGRHKGDLFLRLPEVYIFIQVTLRVGNKASPSLPLPVTTSSTIIVSCAVPHSIELAPLVPRPQLPGLPPCPLEVS